MKSSKSDASTSSSNARHPALRWLEPRSVIVGGVAAVAIGLVFNWNWVVAVGLAPLLFVLPCMLMMGWMMWSMRPKDAGDSTARPESTAQTRNSQQAAPLGAPAAQSKED